MGQAPARYAALGLLPARGAREVVRLLRGKGQKDWRFALRAPRTSAGSAPTLRARKEARA
jgi:hypothetical protein